MIDNTTFTDNAYRIETLGCKLNFAESATLERLLQERGFRHAAVGEVASLCIVNTCSVTETADKKCRQTLRSLIRKNPTAFVAVIGCYAQLQAAQLAEIEGVDIVLGAAHKMELVDYLLDLSKKKQGEIYATARNEIKKFDPSCAKGDRTRYMLKVQDGCDYFCTYCTVPFARGGSRNGSIASLVAQAEEVAASGGKEIVLTGVNIGDFGRTTGESFLSLIMALDGVAGIERYRISSIEPNLLTDDVIDFVATSQRFMPHFHIPLQSGSDAVLQLMHRRYNTALFAQRIAHIKRVMPRAFIGVDHIVGMRGEEASLFEQEYAFVASLPISQLHVFSYSERPGTLALKIEHEVSPQEKHERSQRMLQLSQEKLMTFYKEQIGKTAPVLFEFAPKGKLMHGFTDNYVRVEQPLGSTIHENQIISIQLSAINKLNDAMIGEQIITSTQP